MQFTDTVTLAGTRVTRDGYMVADANIARTGIQIYNGVEVGRPDLKTVRVYRSPDEVFKEKAMGSFAHRPITNDHPAGMVDAKNWKKVAVGALGDKVVRNGECVQVPLVLMDSDAIDDVNNGKRELSCGYICDLDWTPGVTDAGEDYDAQQIDIEGNHLAIVAKGRAGASCRIGDSWTTSAFNQPTQKESAIMADITLRTVLVDGFSVSTNDQGAEAIARLTTQVKDANAVVAARDAALAARDADHRSQMDALRGQIDALRSTHTGALSAKDGEIDALKTLHTGALSAKDAEIAALKAQVPTADTLDALVAERGKTLATVRTVMGDAYTGVGKTDDQMRRDAVGKVMGDAAITGKDEAYIRAAFDTVTSIAARAGTGAQDPIRAAFIGTGVTQDSANNGGRGGSPEQARAAAEQAKAERNRRYADSWRSPSAAA